jgi:DNA polymerase-3 subunit beta
VLLSATDLEISLRCAVTQVEVAEQGDTLVIADTLSRIVRECTDEVMTAETKGNALHLRGAGSHFQIVTHNGEDFPPIPGLEGPSDLSVDVAQLRRLIEWTSFAAARESTRYAINGVLWEVEGTRLTLAATDGRRLSVGHGKLTTPATQGLRKAIVPTKAMSLISRLSSDPSANVDVRITDNQMIVRVGSAVMSTALVEGQFPDYRRVIPEDCDRRAELTTAEFVSALKRAALLTNEESKGVRLSFSDGDLTLSSRAPEQGEATVSLPARYKGESLDIGFNPVFLLDVLKVTPTDEVTFMFRDSNRPGMFKIGDDLLYVVMPVNLTSA